MIEAKKSGNEGWLSNLKAIIGAIAIALVIRITLFEAFAIDGPSMEPTLQHGDRVVVAKYAFGLFLPFSNSALLNWGSPKVGDVIIVHSPMDDADIVKRVVAVAGDTVGFKNDHVLRNGQSILHSELGPCAPEMQKEFDPTCEVYEEQVNGHRYQVSESRYADLPEHREITIPEGHIYVLGDHRDRSNDSRNPLVGPISVDRVKGRVQRVYMSWNPNVADWWARIRWHRVGMKID